MLPYHDRLDFLTPIRPRPSMTAQPCQPSRALSHVATTALPNRRLAQPNLAMTYPNMTCPTLTAVPNPTGPNHAIPDRAAPNQDRHAPPIKTVPNRT